MTSATATVEVLTAEVRVLMVGSRQVTLSVFAQLDSVPYQQVEPMGRVRYHNETWLIGKHQQTGALVRTRPEVYDALGPHGVSTLVAVATGADPYGGWIAGQHYKPEQAKELLGEVYAMEAQPLIVLAGLGR